MSITNIKEKYKKDLRDYYAKEYKRVLNLNSVEDKTVQEYLKKADLDVWSHKNRIIRNIQILKHTYITTKTDIITTCFKVTLDTTSCIYAFLYSNCSLDKKSSVKHKFFCTGPTFRSQDGEYRNRFIIWDQLDQLFAKYAEEFEKVEASVLAKLESGRLSFQTDFYYPIKCTFPRRKMEESINNLRLPIKFFILCWIHDYYNIHYKIAENHMNPAYQYIIYQPEDLPILEALVSKLGHGMYESMMMRIITHRKNVNDPDYNIEEVGCGQKLFPLTAIEAIKTDDINFNVWREIYITNMASNLVLNLISPSFPFINNWFYIQHAHAGMFDNIAMHDKYLHSDIAVDISTQLKNTDKYNYINGDMKKGPISGKFFRLSRNIHKSIIYADSDIKLTDLAVCMTSEYVGRTLRDIPALIVNKMFLPGLDFAFTDSEIFAKHMFEFVYAFYCMNSKIGIIHGDLHMNNATIRRLYQMLDFKGHLYVKNPHIVFILGDETYIFRHFGLFSTIIDFSRGIIGDYDMLVHEFSQRYAEMYFKEQRNRVLQTLFHYFPKLTQKYRDKIESLLLSNFSLMFKILTVIDTYVIMSNINAMFSIDDAFTHGKIKLAPDAFRLLKALIFNAEELMAINIEAAASGKISDPEDIDWPNLLIIKKVFAKHKLTPEIMNDPNINVVDIFNSHNEVIYDVEDYDTWGPLLSLDKEIKLRNKYKLPLHEGIKEWLHFKQTDESPIIEALTFKYEQQEKDVLQFEAWMLM